MGPKKHYSLYCMIPIIAAVIFFIPNGHAMDLDFSGQLSTWFNEAEMDDRWETVAGLRYIPQVTLAKSLTDNILFDIELSANGFAAFSTLDETDDADLDLYRFKIRFATDKMETRIGLQKINFGPALLLRSLQWFDRVDPRDPQRLTDGVYGLRFKYTALNNANYWVWILLDNEDIKGLEFLPSDSEKPEFGARIQHPVPYGEVAATFHTRQIDLSPYYLKDATENRYALDGRWDNIVGFWFEAVLQEQGVDLLPFQWVKFLTLGMDYTFGIGSGLYILGEHLIITTSQDKWKWEDDIQFSAVHVSYPIGFFDSLSAICYYNWDKNQWTPYLSWTRTTDKLDITFSFFKYTESEQNLLGLNRGIENMGSGGQILLIYHY